MGKSTTFLIIIITFFSFLNEAFSSSRVGVIQIGKPEAQVYSKPSFDADIIVSVKKGKKFYALKKKFEGVDGFGLFYKVRLKKKVFGYVLDTEVKGFKPRVSKLKNQESDEDKEFKKQAALSAVKKQKPLVFSRSLGLSLSSLNYAISASSGEKKSNEMFFGARFSGSGLSFTPLPFDVSLLFLPSSPSLFDEFIDEHNGSVIIVEAGVPFEIKRGPNWSTYFNVSAVISRYDFGLFDNGENQSTAKNEFGYSAALGGGYRWGKYIAKADLKYIKVGRATTGFSLSLQREF